MPLLTGTAPTPQQMVDHINLVIVEVSQGKSAMLRDGTTGAERAVTQHDLSELVSLLEFYESRVVAGRGKRFKHANFRNLG